MIRKVFLLEKKKKITEWTSYCLFLTYFPVIFFPCNWHLLALFKRLWKIHGDISHCFSRLPLLQNNNFSKCAIWGTRQEIVYFVEKLGSVLKTFELLYFLPSHDLPNLWCCYEYYYIKQSAFLNISFEPWLIKSPNLGKWYI